MPAPHVCKAQSIGCSLAGCPGISYLPASVCTFFQATTCDVTFFQATSEWGEGACNRQLCAHTTPEYQSLHIESLDVPAYFVYFIFIFNCLHITRVCIRGPRCCIQSPRCCIPPWCTALVSAACPPRMPLLLVCTRGAEEDKLAGCGHSGGGGSLGQCPPPPCVAHTCAPCHSAQLCRCPCACALYTHTHTHTKHLPLHEPTAVGRSVIKSKDCNQRRGTPGCMCK